MRGRLLSWFPLTPEAPQLLFFSMYTFFPLLSLRNRFSVVQSFSELLPKCGQPQRQRVPETPSTSFCSENVKIIGWSYKGEVMGAESCQRGGGKFFIDLKIMTTHIWPWHICFLTIGLNSPCIFSLSLPACGEVGLWVQGSPRAGPFFFLPLICITYIFNIGFCLYH